MKKYLLSFSFWLFWILPICLIIWYWYSAKYSPYGPEDEVPIYMCSKLRSPLITNKDNPNAYSSELNCLEAIQFDVPRKYLRSNKKKKKDIDTLWWFNIYHGDNPQGQYEIDRSNYEFQSVRVQLNSIARRDQQMGWSSVADNPDFKPKKYEQYKVLEHRKPLSFVNKEGKRVDYEAISLQSDLNEKGYYFTSSSYTCMTIPHNHKRCRFEDDYQQYEFPFIELWWTISPHHFEKFPKYRERIIKLVESFYRDDEGKIQIIDYQKLIQIK